LGNKRLARAVAGTMLVLVCAGAALAWQAATKLVINGSVASTDVRSINGRLYAPIGDIAKALGMDVVKRGGQVELTRSGGAGQIANKNTGKLGEEIFTGKYRFKVISMQQTDSYTDRFGQDKKTTDAGPNETLLVLTCRVKNGTQQKDELCFTSGDWGANTALADMDEHSYQAARFDVHRDEDFPPGAYFLPGAAIDFAIVFKVPKETKPKDLVYSIVRYIERADKKSTDVRVSLTP
jgi:hypothetical protein